MPRHSVLERSRIAFSMKICLETAQVEATNSENSWRSANAGGPARLYVSWDRGTKRHAPVPVRPSTGGHMHPCMYIPAGIYWFSRVMHAAVKVPAHANYPVPDSVPPPVGIWPLWPGTFRADSSRAHAPHRVSAPARMRETKSLRRHTHVPGPSRRFRSDSGDRGLRRVADSPEGPLAPDPACPGGTRY